MTHHDPMERLRKACAAAATKRQIEQAALATRHAFPQDGDLVSPPVRSRVVQGWALLHAHVREPALWYAVPADDHVLAGVTDVVVSAEAPYGPLVLRCGNGLWLSPAVLAPDARIGFLEPQYVIRARTLVARFVRGELAGSAARRETEADPEYEAWLAEVDRDRARFEAWVERQGLILTASNAKTAAPGVLAPWLALPEPPIGQDATMPAPRGATAVPDHSPFAFDMAAAPGGADAALLRAFRDKRAGWLTVELQESPLFLLLTAEGVHAFWASSTQRPPRLCGQMADGSTRCLRWRTLGGTPIRIGGESFPWINNEVILDVGAKPGRRVRVRR